MEKKESHQKALRTVSARLPRYLNVLRTDLHDFEYVESGQIAELVGASSAQVRKDFSYFQISGKRGEGYERKKLMNRLMEITGLDEAWEIVLVGAGNLGRALTLHGGFSAPPLKISAVFDNRPEIIGQSLGSIPVLHSEKMLDYIRERKISLGVICVPREVGQSVAEQLVLGGVKAILNFAPLHLNLPEDVHVKNIDIISACASLTYFLKTEKETGKNGERL